MSVTRDLLEGVAGLFVAEITGLSKPVVYRPAGPDYTDAEIGVSLTGMQPSPDWMIALAAYQVGGDDLDLPISRPAIQVRTRGDTDPRTESDIRDAVYTVLHGRRHTTLGSVHVIRFRLASGVELGLDANDRAESSSNYYTVTDMPATTNRYLSR